MTHGQRIHRKRTWADIEKRLEEKRQDILASITDPDLRAEHADTNIGTLICLRNSGRLNMLPGMEDLG